MDGTYQSALHIGFSRCLRQRRFYYAYFGVYLCECEFVDGVLYVCVLFYYGFEVIRQKLLQAANMSYSHVCFSVHGSGACDQNRTCEGTREILQASHYSPRGGQTGILRCIKSHLSKEP